MNALATTPIVDVRNLAVEFHSGGNVVEAVKGVSFNIARGEIVALVGESGSGKTVSALSILKLLPYPAAHHPTGEIHFAGRDLLKASDHDMRDIRGEKISIIFQEPMTSLNPLHSILKQVGEVMKVHHGLDDATVRSRVLALLR
jgi:microcin C transport system ATP-binding protein